MQCSRRKPGDAGVATGKKRAAADSELVDERAQAKSSMASELASSKLLYSNGFLSSVFLSSWPEEQSVNAGVASDKKRAAADLQLVDEKAQAKKFKATELAPNKATKAVWSSIFLSSRPEEKETYGCRALSSRGWA